MVLFERRSYPAHDRRFREELKNEILAELAARPAGWRPYPQEKGVRRLEPLEDQRQEKRYRENLKREIMRDLYHARPPQAQPWDDVRAAGPGRFKQLLASREGRGFGWGVGLTLAAVLLAPGARRYIRPAARKILEEAMEAATRVQRYVTQAKEDLEDLVAEAKFHQMENAARETGDREAPDN